MVRFELHPFDSPRERAARLTWVVLLSLVYLLLAVWNPLRYPGPVLCLSRLAFAVPCPLCGATRGVALCLRGQVVQGTRLNPLSFPAAVLGLAFLGLWSFEYLSNRQVEFIWRRPWRMVFLVVVHAAVLVVWVYLLLYRREDLFSASWLGRWLSI